MILQVASKTTLRKLYVQKWDTICTLLITTNFDVRGLIYFQTTHSLVVINLVEKNGDKLKLQLFS